ncbi:NAD(P)/FAD-dependent oxidoreductase [Tahibacter amnicola]|uniref:FAD-binding oxidoreductase n=1 Tax=Tahibacter amnicola TaxID=2976241 RepID=A0ABY6BBX6_9GAMM|nr:FAD-binding oxidoreductase [Tahibacter amnicola]UXI66620.1 FAD-binding oxidoreductase [Tahibacter amnicola]
MTQETTSYYRATATAYGGFAPIEGRHEKRVVIVGGGYAGLNTALGLAERGMDGVCVLERETVGFGASGRNGGFVFAGYSLGEHSLVRTLGAERAKALFLSTVGGVQLIRSRVAKYKIPCAAVDEGVIWANWFRDPAVLRDRQRFLAERFGVQWEWLPRQTLRELLRTDRYSEGVWERNALHLHPLNYAIGIAQAAAGQGVAVHEHSGVRSIERSGNGWLVRTELAQIQAEHVVLSCGGYLAGLDRRIDRSILPIATYVMVTEPLGVRLREAINTRAAIYDTRFAFDYYRPLPDSRLLWGGRISVLDRSPEQVRDVLLRDLHKVFPQLDGVRVDFAWSGLMSYARHQMPQIGQKDKGLWYAQAFGGHGVAPTTVAGELLAAAIAKDDTAWQAFAPFGLVSSFRPMGFLGAQANYWWYQAKDWYKAWREG